MKVDIGKKHLNFFLLQSFNITAFHDCKHCITLNFTVEFKMCSTCQRTRSNICTIQMAEKIYTNIGKCYEFIWICSFHRFKTNYAFGSFANSFAITFALSTSIALSHCKSHWKTNKFTTAENHRLFARSKHFDIESEGRKKIWLSAGSLYSLCFHFLFS